MKMTEDYSKPQYSSVDYRPGQDTALSSSLLSLPTELVTYIAELIHPSEIVNFSLVDRAIYNCAEACLGDYNRRAAKWRISSDLNPVPIVQTTQDFMNGSIDAFFVRTIEIWNEGRSIPCRWAQELEYGPKDVFSNGQNVLEFDGRGVLVRPDHVSEEELCRFQEFMVRGLGFPISKHCRAKALARC